MIKVVLYKVEPASGTAMPCEGTGVRHINLGPIGRTRRRSCAHSTCNRHLTALLGPRHATLDVALQPPR